MKKIRFKNIAHNRPVVFDLFCGCGGLSLGLEHSGMQILWANDIWDQASTTYKMTHPKANLINEDAHSLFIKIFQNDSGLPKRGDVDLIVGGPPCQGFSGYNRYRSPEDPRNSMVELFLNYIEHLRPRYVLMENVPGMLSIDSGKVAKLIVTTFKELGYVPQLKILQAGYYGLPQNRWRVFILAAMEGEKIPKFPEPTHEFTRTIIFGAKAFREAVIKAPNKDDLLWPLSSKVTVGDAISDLPPIKNGSKKKELSYRKSPQSSYQKSMRNGQEDLYNHICSNLGPIMFERVKSVPKRPGAGWLDMPDHLKPNNLAKHGDKRYDNRFGRLHWTGIFNTILTKPEPYWGRVIHPEQDRVLSVRECARAQGFPDSVRFNGKIGDKYKQIGNAVPPILAQAIGLKIMEAMGHKIDTGD